MPQNNNNNHVAIRGYIMAGLFGAVTMHIATLILGDNKLLDYTKNKFTITKKAKSDNNNVNKKKKKDNQDFYNITGGKGVFSHVEKRHPLLPSKLYTIVGLESSGTTFMAYTIGKALGLEDAVEFSSNGHEGIYLGYWPGSQRNYTVEVQHVSLPWGSRCQDVKNAWRDENLVPVVYPFVCMNTQRKIPRYRTVREIRLWNTCRDHIIVTTRDDENHKRGSLFPRRYILDLTKHVEWYRERGVDVHLIIMERDFAISRVARGEHCGDNWLLQKEEQISSKMIRNVIQKYITGQPSPSSAQEDKHFGGIMSSKDHKIMVVSYEMLNMFQYDYLQILYQMLGIQSTYNPQWKDGNVKYVTPTSRKKSWHILQSIKSSFTMISETIHNLWNKIVEWDRQFYVPDS